MMTKTDVNNSEMSNLKKKLDLKLWASEWYFHHKLLKLLILVIQKRKIHIKFLRCIDCIYYNLKKKLICRGCVATPSEEGLQLAFNQNEFFSQLRKLFWYRKEWNNRWLGFGRWQFIRGESIVKIYNSWLYLHAT